LTSVAYVVGARPNFVKLAPVYHVLRARLAGHRHVLVHTGQHYDRAMSESFVEELGLPDADHHLGVGSGTHGTMTGRALERIEAALIEERPRLAIVVGDVNSTLAAALAAAKLEIPVAHVEAGLRSFDPTMPEELNRRLTDQLSRWCFIHSPEARDHLLAEGVAPERIHAVGNTMIDTLVRLRERIDESDATERLGLERGGYGLVTLHRPALVDGPLFEPALDALERVGAELPLVYPVHPRARARLDADRPDAGLRLVDPLPYIDFLALESRAAAVITDSGGVQEETTFLGIPCFTLRANTERPVTVERGTNRMLGLDVARLLDVPELLARTNGRRPPPPDGWDGRAAERIADVLVPYLEGEER
jgi:UDP-N-acetylglucosamine 2-epimerase (non-hydrolysing)